MANLLSLNVVSDACIKELMWLRPAGTQIEEPFATLPLDAYCEMMSRHAKEQYERRRGVLPHLDIPTIYQMYVVLEFLVLAMYHMR